MEKIRKIRKNPENFEIWIWISENLDILNSKFRPEISKTLGQGESEFWYPDIQYVWIVYAVRYYVTPVKIAVKAKFANSYCYKILCLFFKFSLWIITLQDFPNKPILVELDVILCEFSNLVFGKFYHNSEKFYRLHKTSDFQFRLNNSNTFCSIFQPNWQ